MANPTSNFGWQMPTPTDLVTDLPADFEVFGQAVDTSMADLKGGTSGQILAKNSNTDMDFVWIANDQGDITGVTATSPLTGGGTSGAVTVGIQSASTTQSGAVQLSDSTSTTSSVLASTPTATKSAYDLAAAAIPKSTVTTNGDLIYGTGSSTVSRIGIGSSGQVLSVSGGVPAWATVTTAAPGLAFVSATSFTSATSASINNCFTSTYDNYFVTVTVTSGSAAQFFVKMRLSGTDSSASYGFGVLTFAGSTVSTVETGAGTAGFETGMLNQGQTGQATFTLLAPAIAKYTYFQAQNFTGSAGGTGGKIASGNHYVNTAYDGMTINWTNSSTGTIRVYGYRNS